MLPARPSHMTSGIWPNRGDAGRVPPIARPAEERRWTDAPAGRSGRHSGWPPHWRSPRAAAEAPRPRRPLHRRRACDRRGDRGPRRALALRGRRRGPHGEADRVRRTDRRLPAGLVDEGGSWGSSTLRSSEDAASRLVSTSTLSPGDAYVQFSQQHDHVGRHDGPGDAPARSTSPPCSAGLGHDGRGADDPHGGREACGPHGRLERRFEAHRALREGERRDLRRRHRLRRPGREGRSRGRACSGWSKA